MGPIDAMAMGPFLTLVSGVADGDFNITSQVQPEVNVALMVRCLSMLHLTPVILDAHDVLVILHLCSKLILVPFSRVQVQPRAGFAFPPTPAMMLLFCIDTHLPLHFRPGCPLSTVVPPGAGASPPRAGAPPTAGEVDVSAAMVVAMQRKLQARTMVAAVVNT